MMMLMVLRLSMTMPGTTTGCRRRDRGERARSNRSGVRSEWRASQPAACAGAWNEPSGGAGGTAVWSVRVHGDWSGWVISSRGGVRSDGRQEREEGGANRFGIVFIGAVLGPGPFFGLAAALGAQRPLLWLC